MRLLILLILLAFPAYAADPAPAPPQGAKYESLRFGKIKLRTGPGAQYPVAWIYQRKALPVEVLANYDTWRKIADPDGTIGWVQETMLSDKRTVMVVKTQATLRHDPAATAATVALADPGTIAKVVSCQGGWCHVKFDDYEGWLDQKSIWGTASGEIFEK